MKRTLLFFSIMATCSMCLAQFLVLPAGNKTNRVDVGRINVTGQAITVEALIMEQAKGLSNNLVSKHSRPTDVNYVLRTSGFFVQTTRGGGVARNPVTFCPGKVYHVAGTYDGKSVKYFVNGVMVSSAPCSGNMIQNDFVTAIGGKWEANSTYEQFRGYISEVRMWKVARTAAEISANMLDLPDPSAQPGLLAYYKFAGSYINLQGNSAYNGKPTKGSLFLGKNPDFDGSLASTFCGGNVSIQKLIAVAPPLPPVQPVPPAISPPPVQQARPHVLPAPIPKEVSEPVKPQERAPAAPASKPPVANVPVKNAPVLKQPAAEPAVPTREQATIVVWDFDGLDGDSISMKMNDKQIGPAAIRLAEFKTYGSPETTFTTDLPGGEITLELAALSEGSLPFATIGLLISEKRHSQRYYIRLRKGEKAAVHFVRN